MATWLFGITERVIWHRRRKERWRQWLGRLGRRDHRQDGGARAMSARCAREQAGHRAFLFARSRAWPSATELHSSFSSSTSSRVERSPTSKAFASKPCGCGCTAGGAVAQAIRPSWKGGGDESPANRAASRSGRCRAWRPRARRVRAWRSRAGRRVSARYRHPFDDATSRLSGEAHTRILQALRLGPRAKGNGCGPRADRPWLPSSPSASCRWGLVRAGMGRAFHAGLSWVRARKRSSTCASCANPAGCHFRRATTGERTFGGWRR